MSELVWEGVFEKYARTIVYANLWRVNRTCSDEDALQEAACLFFRMRKKYEDKVDGPNHFMGLYKTGLARMLHDLSKVSSSIDSNEVAESALPFDSEEDASVLDALMADSGQYHSPSAHMDLMIRQAPQEVKSVLNLLMQMPHDVATVVEAAWKKTGQKSFGNKHLCKLLGYDYKTTDLVSLVQTYLIKS